MNQEEEIGIIIDTLNEISWSILFPYSHSPEECKVHLYYEYPEPNSMVLACGKTIPKMDLLTYYGKYLTPGVFIDPILSRVCLDCLNLYNSQPKRFKHYVSMKAEKTDCERIKIYKLRHE